MALQFSEATLESREMRRVLFLGRNPPVLLRGGAFTIQSTFGRILPALACARRVIAVELQCRGHALDIDGSALDRTPTMTELLRQLASALGHCPGFQLSRP